MCFPCGSMSGCCGIQPITAGRTEIKEIKEMRSCEEIDEDLSADSPPF